MYSLNFSKKIKKYSVSKYNRLPNSSIIARCSNNLHLKLICQSLNSNVSIVRLERLSNSLISTLNDYSNNNSIMRKISNDDYQSPIFSSVETIQFNEQLFFQNSDIDHKTKIPSKINYSDEYQTYINSNASKVQLPRLLDSTIFKPDPNFITNTTVQTHNNNDSEPLIYNSLEINQSNYPFMFDKNIIDQKISPHDKISSSHIQKSLSSHSDNYLVIHPNEIYPVESTTHVVNFDKWVLDKKIDSDEQLNLTHACFENKSETDNQLPIKSCDQDQNNLKYSQENINKNLHSNSKLKLPSYESVIPDPLVGSDNVHLSHSSNEKNPNSKNEKKLLKSSSLGENDNLNSILNISNFDLIFNTELNSSILTHIQQHDNILKFPSDSKNSSTVINNLNQSTDNNFTFIEMQFIPSNKEELLSMISNEKDMVNWKVGNNISATLETILSSDFNGNQIDLIRESEEVTDETKLSPMKLRKLDRFDKNKMDDISVLGIAEPNCSSYSKIDQSINDKTYSPQDKTSHEITNEEIVQLPPVISSDEECSSKANSLLQIEEKACKLGCDNSKLTVQSSSEPKCNKQHCCFYCHKRFTKIARHLESVHRDEADVKKFTLLPKGSREHLEIITIRRNKGNFKYNTNPSYNKGDLITSRRPNIKYQKKADEYKTCVNCLNTFSIANIRHHTKKCTNGKIVGQREILVMGKAIEGRLHSSASDKLRSVVFPRLRENDIIKLIRYDWIIIIYGNKLCLRYTLHFQHNMIRARLRLLGRLMFAIKSINRDVTDFASLYDPKFYDSVVEGIKIVTGFDKVDEGYRAPSPAENLVTYIKQVGLILINEYIKLKDPIKQTNVENFLKIHDVDMPLSINKIAIETQARLQRQKKVVLPSKKDVNTIVTCINQERKSNYLKLLEGYTLSDYRYGVELCALYLVVFNRRRVGEIENILIDDYNNWEGIDQKTDADLYNALCSEDKVLAQKYRRFLIRGKKNHRNVGVLLIPELIKHIDQLLKYRENTGIPESNKFLFALPKFRDPYVDKTVDLCHVMRKISNASGADNPRALRGTQLRKQIATMCVELDLSDNTITNLANFMGHADKIHKDIYRQPIKCREIIKISRLLEAARGEDDDEDDINTDDENVDNNNTSNMHNFDLDNSPIASSSMNESKISEASKKPENKVYSENDGLGICKYKKTMWTKEEKSAIFEHFEKYLQDKRLPSYSAIEEIKKIEDLLVNRTTPQIKAWINNYLKKNSQNKISKTEKITVVSDEPININIEKFKKIQKI